MLRATAGVLLFLLAASCGKGRAEPETPSAFSSRRLFRSGFETGTAYGGPLLSPSGAWVADLSGGDDAGFVWPTDLPGGRETSGFFFIADGAKDLDTLIETRLEQVEDRAGQPSTALYQAVLKYDKSLHAPARNMYLVMNDGHDDLKQGYVRYWLKLQPDLEAVLPQDAWRQIIEWREAGDGYRFALNITRDRTTGRLLWTTHGDFATLNSWARDWEVQQRDVAIPIGDWFLLEAYWEHGATDGRLLVKVNCQTVADHSGRTRDRGPLDSLHLFKVYASESSLAMGPAYQWVDDVELRDELEPAKCE